MQYHRLYKPVEATYKQVARVLKLFLQENETINSEVAPRAYNLLVTNILEEDRFKILQQAAFKLIPQLGRYDPDMHTIVAQFNPNEHDTMIMFHNRECMLYNEIMLQRDDTGQHHRLIHRYVNNSTINCQIMYLQYISVSM